MHFITKNGYLVKRFHYDDSGEVMAGIFMSWQTKKYPKDLEMVARFEK